MWSALRALDISLLKAELFANDCGNVGSIVLVTDYTLWLLTYLELVRDREAHVSDLLRAPAGIARRCRDCCMLLCSATQHNRLLYGVPVGRSAITSMSTGDRDECKTAIR